MTPLRRGLDIQVRVVKALMVRELITRFGRENIGFLWVMVEPLLFAVLVGILWRFEKGAMDHGISVIAFVATGYIPLVLFRTSISRSVGALTANASLLYHRQVKILDLVLVRFIIEFIGHSMAYIFIASLLIAVSEFPVPTDMSVFMLGWLYWGLFTLSVCLICAALSEMSDIVEKVSPVTVYMMVPFSGTFFMASWLTRSFARVVSYSPPVHAMEMMRSGIFGPAVAPQYDLFFPLTVILPLMLLGLALCRRVRRTMVVE